jgi:hypothetical protein
MTTDPTAATTISTPITAELVRGAAELEPVPGGLAPHRLPAWARAQFPDGQLLMAEEQPAGVRLVFRTAATVIALGTRPTKVVYAGVPPRPDGVYDLLVDGVLTAQTTVSGGDTLEVDLRTGQHQRRAGPAGTALFSGLPAHDKRVELWLPWNERTELVTLRTDAPVEPPAPGQRPVWLHHGSSISHGSNAASPTTTWPAVAAREADVDLVNLGLGGSALLDPFVARVLRDTRADLVSLKIGINLVNTDLMRRRAFVPAVHGFLDTIRDGHPETPLLVVSPLYCPIHETTPGPAALDPSSLSSGQPRFLATGDPRQIEGGALTLRVIREELAAIVQQRAASDAHLSYLDGTSLYGAVDHEDFPLADNLHPGPGAHLRIGSRFARLALGAMVRG